MNLPATAIYFNPDQVEGKGRGLVGRRSAGEGFLKGYLAHGCGDTIRALSENPALGRAFEEKLASLGERRPVKMTYLRGGGDFADAGCIFNPRPGFGRMAWSRQRFGPNTVSLVGVTHTMATRRIVEGLHALVGEPVEDWDAIICTSRAVQSVVKHHFEIETAYFRQRFGAARVPLPRLPVIPLGVETAAFAPLPGERERVRERHGAGAGAVVVLTVGRLSVIEKANPVPLFMALEEVAQEIGRESGREVHLWMAGWAARPEEEALHREGAAALCPSVRVTMVDGRDADVRRNIWAGADIFTLPVDSIQETFGLVPVEAMAAGLPVVMPDWNGFRDTVRHGVTGFLVPTRMSPPGAGGLIAQRFAEERDNYLQHLALVQGQVQLDLAAYREAFLALMDEGLRARMGAAGMAHARAVFDWGAVIPQYLDLARELEAVRATGQPSTPPLGRRAPNPFQFDPFAIYADYPTEALGPDTPVRPGRPVGQAEIEAYDRFSGRKLYQRQLISVKEALDLHGLVVRLPGVTVADLARIMNRRMDFVVTAVLYLAKADLVRLPVIGPRRQA
jgi:starch synthase